jgi:virginiamycin A acetyltransferase
LGPKAFKGVNERKKSSLNSFLNKIPVVRQIVKAYDKSSFQKKWKAKNSHNFTSIGERLFPIGNVQVGHYSYGLLNIVSLYEQENEKLIIGNFVSIAPGVQFLMGVNHQMNTITSYPLYSRFVEYSKIDANSRGDIKIDDEVWIGTNSLIMSGISIGKGAIIAAGSIVTKDVPPYTIFGGNPAKLIKPRFSEEIIQELMTFNLMDIKIENIKKNISLFYSEINSLDDIKRLKKEILEHNS